MLREVMLCRGKYLLVSCFGGMHFFFDGICCNMFYFIGKHFLLDECFT